MTERSSAVAPAQAAPFRPNPWSAQCPSRELIDVLSSKWVLLLMPLLRSGPKRNAELMRELDGVSQKVLVQTLRSLENRRLVVRRDHGEMPLHVEYELTDLGRSLADVIGVLDDWVVQNYNLTIEGDAL